VPFEDIVPLSKPTFTQVLFEVFIGTFYIAIIIAKLIGGLAVVVNDLEAGTGFFLPASGNIHPDFDPELPPCKETEADPES
jgi:hypothetical protein